MFINFLYNSNWFSIHPRYLTIIWFLFFLLLLFLGIYKLLNKNIFNCPLMFVFSVESIVYFLSSLSCRSFVWLFLAQSRPTPDLTYMHFEDESECHNWRNIRLFISILSDVFTLFARRCIRDLN